MNVPLIVNAAETLDFSYHFDYNTGFNAGCIAAAIFTVFGIILAIRQKSVFPLTMGPIMGILVCMIVFMGNFLFNLDPATDKQVTELQSWASDTYMLDISDDDANILIEKQLDVTNVDDTDELQEHQRVVIMDDAYGDNVRVSLIKDGDTYTLILLKDSAVQTK